MAIRAYNRFFRYCKQFHRGKTTWSHRVAHFQRFGAPNFNILLFYGTIDSKHTFFGKTILDKYSSYPFKLSRHCYNNSRPFLLFASYKSYRLLTLCWKRKIHLGKIRRAVNHSMHSQNNAGQIQTERIFWNNYLIFRLFLSLFLSFCVLFCLPGLGIPYGVAPIWKYQSDNVQLFAASDALISLLMLLPMCDDIQKELGRY